MGERDNGYVGCDARRQTRYGQRSRTGGCSCGCGSGDRRQGGTLCGCANGDRRQGGTLCGSCRQARNERNERSDFGGCPCQRNDRPAEGVCARGECHALMHKLQELDFAIQETVLYLDAYPECGEALAYYHQLIKERCAVAKEYESSCGPLAMRGNENAHAWDWVGAPWPWSPEFPGNKRL